MYAAGVNGECGPVSAAYASTMICVLFSVSLDRLR
jgi:hypothetical protein